MKNVNTLTAAVVFEFPYVPLLRALAVSAEITPHSVHRTGRW
jgi:hypothetical protein